MGAAGGAGGGCPQRPPSGPGRLPPSPDPTWSDPGGAPRSRVVPGRPSGLAGARPRQPCCSRWRRHPRSRPGEGAARCHLTCAQRVVRRSRGAGWGRSGARGAGAASGTGTGAALEPGSPAVPTRGEQISVAPRAPPAPPPSPPPQLFPATSCWYQQPARASRSPPPPSPAEARAGTRVPQAGAWEESPAARTPALRRGRPSSPASGPPAGPAAEPACLLPGTGGEAIIN